MKHPIDVTFGSVTLPNGQDADVFQIVLIQENPSYADALASEHVLCFETCAEVEKFCASQGLEPIYDDEAQDVLDDGREQDDD